MMSIVKTKYRKILEGPRETVSVHISKKQASDPHQDRLEEHWQMHAVDKMFDVSTMVFLLFAEEPDKLKSLILRVAATHGDFSFVIVKENKALSLALMSLCKHHIISSSLSFWGMFVSLAVGTDHTQVRIWIKASRPAA
jgi:hypothetical protein